MRELWKTLSRTCYLKDNSVRQIRDKKTVIQRNTSYAKKNCGKNKVKDGQSFQDGKKYKLKLETVSGSYVEPVELGANNPGRLYMAPTRAPLLGDGAY